MRYLKITPPVATTVHKTLLVSVTVVDGAKYYRPIGLLDRAHQTLRSRYTDVHRPFTRHYHCSFCIPSTDTAGGHSKCQ